jgi:hypothetical protein
MIADEIDLEISIETLTAIGTDVIGPGAAHRTVKIGDDEIESANETILLVRTILSLSSTVLPDSRGIILFPSEIL